MFLPFGLVRRLGPPIPDAAVERRVVAEPDGGVAAMLMGFGWDSWWGSCRRGLFNTVAITYRIGTYIILIVHNIYEHIYLRVH